MNHVTTLSPKAGIDLRGTYERELAAAIEQRRIVARRALEAAELAKTEAIETAATEVFA